jgi:1,4-alpha-glucan branching enzyme
MGWMHDTLLYFSKDPIYRRYHHNNLTFGFLYAFSENFVLPLSHDEVVHGKGSLLTRMPGDEWQKFANLRALYGWMWAHPGKKLLFMGGEFGQGPEWSEATSLHWHQTAHWGHGGVQALVAELNRGYQNEPSLWEQDASPSGFQWLQPNNADQNVLAFVRWSKGGDRHLVCVANLSPEPQTQYRLGFPQVGAYAERLNTDSSDYGGSGMGNMGRVETREQPWDQQPASALLTLPPLSVLWFLPLSPDSKRGQG